jgi:hypothetical protein
MEINQKTNDRFKSIGLLVHPMDHVDSKFTNDTFRIIQETLTRVGIGSSKESKLTQTCHILHKQGLYKIVHFKEMFIMDGKEATLSDEDIKRRNTIAVLLEDWGLLDIHESEVVNEDNMLDNDKSLTILSYKQKSKWELVSKYTIGRKK